MTKPVQGLLLLSALALFDVVGPMVLPAATVDTPGPPTAVVVLGVVLGLVSLALVAVLVWHSGGRAAALGLVACRVLSALTGVPAFFVEGVPLWVRLLEAVVIALTGLGVWLLLSDARAAPVAGEG